jgi:hypothetical protein
MFTTVNNFFLKLLRRQAHRQCVTISCQNKIKEASLNISLFCLAGCKIQHSLASRGRDVTVKRRGWLHQGLMGNWGLRETAGAINTHQLRSCLTVTNNTLKNKLDIKYKNATKMYKSGCLEVIKLAAYTIRALTTADVAILV